MTTDERVRNKTLQQDINREAELIININNVRYNR